MAGIAAWPLQVPHGPSDQSSRCDLTQRYIQLIFIWPILNRPRFLKHVRKEEKQGYILLFFQIFKKVPSTIKLHLLRTIAK